MVMLTEFPVATADAISCVPANNRTNAPSSTPVTSNDRSVATELLLLAVELSSSATPESDAATKSIETGGSTTRLRKFWSARVCPTARSKEIAAFAAGVVCLKGDATICFS